MDRRDLSQYVARRDFRPIGCRPVASGFFLEVHVNVPSRLLADDAGGSWSIVWARRRPPCFVSGSALRYRCRSTTPSSPSAADEPALQLGCSWTIDFIAVFGMAASRWPSSGPPRLDPVRRMELALSGPMHGALEFADGSACEKSLITAAHPQIAAFGGVPLMLFLLTPRSRPRCHQMAERTEVPLPPASTPVRSRDSTVLSQPLARCWTHLA